MIVREILFINGRELVKTYSDSGKYIIQNETGIEYVEAVDIPNKHTYTESERDIEVDEELQKQRETQVNIENEEVK